jgi:hypothetical protein
MNSTKRFFSISERTEETKTNINSDAEVTAIVMAYKKVEESTAKKI